MSNQLQRLLCPELQIELITNWTLQFFFFQHRNNELPILSRKMDQCNNLSYIFIYLCRLISHSLMLPNSAQINSIAASILKDYDYLFPSTYPDIPLNLTMLKNALSKAGLVTEKNEIPDIMQQVELALASMVVLNWSNFGSIAILLNQQYPEENLLALSGQRITELIKALPNFTDVSNPEEDVIDSIIYTWISLTDKEFGFNEDEAWN